MRALRWLRGFVWHNLGWKVLSLLIAVVIWFLVASEPELSTFANARLVYRNLPDDLEIASEPPTDVSLELRGPSGELRGLGDGVRPLVVIDMSAVQRGERTFPIGDGNVHLGRRVHLVRAVPSEVRFTFERRLVRNVPVRVRFNGNGQNGYAVTSWQAHPSELTIVGPSGPVAGVTAAVTDPIDVSNVVGTKEFQVNAFVDNQYVRFQSPPLVAVTVTMKKLP